MSSAYPVLATLSLADASIRLGIVDGIPDLRLDDFSGIEIEATMQVAGHDAADAHGTEICSILFDRDTGLAVGASGLVLPVFLRASSDQSSSPRASQMDIARALTMAAERGIDIVNVSAGQLSSTPEAGRHLEDALKLCHRRGMLVVAAAGNDGCACLHVPAAVATVLAVGAMDDDGKPLEISNFGASYAENGILAPGADVTVTTLGGRRVRRTGTSYATAVVSGVAARLLATARQSGHPLDASDIRSLLIETADPCSEAVDGDCARILAGKLNVAAAIAQLHRRIGRSKEESAPGSVFPPKSTGRGIMSDYGMMQSTSGPSTLAGIAAMAAADADVGQSACGCGGDKKGGCSCGGKGTCTCQGKHAHDDHEHQAKQSALSMPSEIDQSAAVTQQGCGCGESKPPQKVYAIGSLWFDFGTEARYDAIVQQIGGSRPANDPPTLFNFLAENLPFASGITFILMQDQIPIYAVAPSGPFAIDIYRSMIEAVESSIVEKDTGQLQRVAMPGFVHGSTRLMNGMVLPVLYPDIRGMVKWQAEELAKAAKRAINDQAVDEGPISNFLVRVYDELRNLGISPEDRAINFAATNAYQTATVFADAMKRRLELYRFGIKKSPICRPDSDCWDVQMIMFDPENDRRAGRIYRFTIDVSEVLPVTVGLMRDWSAPLGSI